MSIFAEDFFCDWTIVVSPSSFDSLRSHSLFIVTKLDQYSMNISVLLFACRKGTENWIWGIL